MHVDVIDSIFIIWDARRMNVRQPSALYTLHTSDGGTEGGRWNLVSAAGVGLEVRMSKSSCTL